MRQLQRFEDLIPEIRAQERLDEVTVALAPHLKPSSRMEILRPWLDLTRGPTEPAHPQSHDRAWDSLRTLVSVGR